MVETLLFVFGSGVVVVLFVYLYDYEFLGVECINSLFLSFFLSAS